MVGRAWRLDGTQAHSGSESGAPKKGRPARATAGAADPAGARVIVGVHDEGLNGHCLQCNSPSWTDRLIAYNTWKGRGRVGAARPPWRPGNTQMIEATKRKEEQKKKKNRDSATQTARNFHSTFLPPPPGESSAPAPRHSAPPPPRSPPASAGACPAHAWRAGRARAVTGRVGAGAANSAGGQRERARGARARPGLGVARRARYRAAPTPASPGGPDEGARPTPARRDRPRPQAGQPCRAWGWVAGGGGRACQATW